MAVFHRVQRPRCDRRSMPRRRCTGPGLAGQRAVGSPATTGMPFISRKLSPRRTCLRKTLHLAVSNSEAVKSVPRRWSIRRSFTGWFTPLATQHVSDQQVVQQERTGPNGYTAKSSPLPDGCRGAGPSCANGERNRPDPWTKSRPEDPQRTRGERTARWSSPIKHSNVSIGWGLLIRGGLRRSADVMVDFTTSRACWFEAVATGEKNRDRR